MADLSHLGGLNPVEALDLAAYAENKKSGFQLPPKGIYTLESPPNFPSAAFTRTKNGDLQIQIDPTIVGPTNEGFTLRYIKVSAKPFKRGKGTASMVGDYLVACGFKGVLSDEQAIADAVEATAGSVWQASLDWRAYNSRTGYKLEGMEKFPKTANGSYQSWVIDPQEVGKTDSEGRQLRVFASLYIPLGGFIPAE